jgi:alanine dehydrogenase
LTLILNNEEIEQILTMDLCLDILEHLYQEYGAGNTVDIPRCDATVPLGWEESVYGLKTMSGVVPYLGKAALRLNSDVIHWPTLRNIPRRVKIPAASGKKWVGLVLLFDMKTGEPLAILPDGVIQRMRVGATNGLAAKYLSRKDSKVLALIGSGWQAGTQAMAFCAVRDLEEIRVFSPDPNHRRSFCDGLEPWLKVKMIPQENAEEAVEGADILAAATSSMVPVFKREWLRAGIHVSAIKKQEMSWDVVAGCQLFFLHTHRIASQTNYYMEGSPGPQAEVEKGWWFERKEEIVVRKRFPDLGDLVTGRAPGRTRPDQITGFLNNIGLGIQFAAVGAKIYEMAREQGLGRSIPTDWLLQSVHP